MGVMACDRSGCSRIMCTKLVLDNTRYICYDCWDELEMYRNTWPTSMTIADVRRYIEKFMDSEHGSHIRCNNASEIDAEFKRLTGDAGV